MPTTHSSTIDRKRQALISSIFNMCYINVGRLISEKIYKCAKAKQGHLFYPCLITKLCHRAEVPVLLDDLITPIRQGWTRSKILDIMFVMRAVPEAYAAPEAAEFDGPTITD